MHGNNSDDGGAFAGSGLDDKCAADHFNALPDFYNVSNMLRTLGAYLEAKNARLLEIQKRPMTVTILYQNESGHPDVEDRTIASFYNFFIEQYGKRARSGS